MRWLFALVLSACLPEPPPPSPSAAGGDDVPAGASTAPVAAPAADLGSLKIEVLDVGQGDAILLRSPDDKRVLIDAGTGNKGEAALPLLQARGIDRLDLVIATHPHSDHIGGLDEVLAAMPVKRLIDNGLPHTTDTYEKVMKLVEERGVAWQAGKLGQVIKLDHDVKITVLNPDGSPIEGSRSDLNANSVVVRVTHGPACFLFTGDSEAETEEKLTGHGLEPCDVLKSAHHGSGYSNTAAFLAAVHPQIALISVGAGNKYGHPDPEALERFEAEKIKVFRTDELGTITLESTGDQIRVQPERGAPLTITPRGAGRSTTASAASGGAGLLDLNQASAEELEALPGIGEKTAAAILSWRAANGRFTSVDQLDQVPGIGPTTLEKIRPLVTASR